MFHFYIAKLGYAGVYLFFFVSKNRLWVLVRTASPSGSNEYPQSMLWAKLRKISIFFLLKLFIFYNLGNICSSDAHVFVMKLLSPCRFTTVSQIKADLYTVHQRPRSYHLLNTISLRIQLASLRLFASENKKKITNIKRIPFHNCSLRKLAIFFKF